jgi:tight adherence protein C
MPELFTPDAEFSSLQVAGAVFFTFMGVFFLVLAVLDLVQRRADIRKRALVDIGLPIEGTSVLPEQSWRTTRRSLRLQSVSSTSALLGAVERRAGEERETEASKIRRDLLQAGFFSENALLWYQGSRMFLTIGFALTGLIVLNLYFPDASGATMAMVLATLAALGFLLPSRYVASRQKRMEQECRDGFPDFMDLMVICAESGLSPRASVDRISREIAQTYPFLGANLYLSSLELRAGSSLHEAMTRLGKRIRIDEIASLGSLLQQAEQFGTSITDALRVYADEMRDKRLLRAEERAHSLPVKLVVPLGIYVFPVMLVVILLPVVIRIRNSLF